VGEIFDEAERVTPEFRKLNRKTYTVLGKADIEVVNMKLRTKFKAEGEFDTLSGYILNKLGRIPKEREKVRIEDEEITIQKVQGNRIIEVKIKKK